MQTITSYFWTSTQRLFSLLCPQEEDVLKEIPLFGRAEWEKKGIQIEAPEIPHAIIEYLEASCCFWPDKQVRESHFLFLVPDHFNLKQLYASEGGESGSHFLSSFAESNARPYWVLITKKSVPTSRELSFQRQKELLSSYNYRLPTLLEAAIAVVAAKSLGLTLFPRRGLFTRCQIPEGSWPLAIGSDSCAPFSITRYDGNGMNGAAGVYVV